ncbi:CgeB family protein [Evansella cellulosilytica]|uniref:Glycosyl transferase family protein n=1 Tax=Evansella cellulosilytica (strain ATCC 21833 / DSM 2522 / FERM P-1141 / JCM 9156 / N-4) TaxID=649639 RepID=E6TSB6_EVAC2|nr:glycosyltransferase [Evansella cellulosilytica]ADU31885.1 glycosyl transferase family protein [Evansella cellulosilytica DSM 2522]
MKWIIKNPAPTDWRQDKWGDFHFGRSLTKYLSRMNQKVETDYHGEWDNNKTADVVLVLRGKHPYTVKKSDFNIMWNISHPESVTLEEYQSYDIVFVASNSHAEYLSSKIQVPVFPLLQCTDTEEFYESSSNYHDRKDIIFVGNTRGVERACVIWSSELGLPLKVWGRGWVEMINKKLIVGKYIDNQKLGELYSNSKIVLNDHWEDMKQYGFINNRIFDAIACGLPIISDYHEELYKLFGNKILYYKDKEEFNLCVEEFFLAYPLLKENVDELKEEVTSNYSFQNRAQFLVETVEEHIRKNKV